MFFTLRESRGYRISFVVKGSRYFSTASPFPSRSCSILDFCNVGAYPLNFIIRRRLEEGSHCKCVHLAAGRR
jgi:hypothetical protein